MDNAPDLDGRLETAAWGLLLILWGITIFFDRIPFGVGLLGTGLILLGLNALRSAKNLQTPHMTTYFGLLALAWGSLELLRFVPHAALPFVLNDWAIFSILLVMTGSILLVGVVRPAGRK